MHWIAAEAVWVTGVYATLVAALLAGFRAFGRRSDRATGGWLQRR